MSRPRMTTTAAPAVETPPGYAYSAPSHLAARLMRRVTRARVARPARLELDRPVLSVCFDDFPKSAATLGANLLERYGARGTFYAAGSLASTVGPHGPNFDADDVTRLISRGHEIGCHTFSHADCARRAPFDTLRDLAANRDALAAMGCAEPLNALAYPYGETSFALKTALPPRYLSARSTNGGLNAGRVDLTHLRAYALYGDNPATALTALRAARQRRAWLIVYTHDVADAPSAWGVTPAALDRFLAEARAADVVIAPVTQVVRRAFG